MQKKTAVIQSNYLPWKGYFDIIHDVEVFVFYDDVQFTKNDCRNRNKIKTDKGASWLTIPVGKDINRLICEVELSTHEWQSQHWGLLNQWYSKAPYFNLYKEFFKDFYLGKNWKSLSELNQYLISKISKDFLGLQTKFIDSRLFNLKGVREERLLKLLEKVEAQHYVTGPAARNYLEPAHFAQNGMTLEFKDYSSYVEYPQLHPPFVHEVSIVDLLFNCGPQTAEFIWGKSST